MNDMETVKKQWETAKKITSMKLCKFNSGVRCNIVDRNIPGKCERCGWNPAEASRRKMELRKKEENTIWSKSWWSNNR